MEVLDEQKCQVGNDEKRRRKQGKSKDVVP